LVKIILVLLVVVGLVVSVTPGSPPAVHPSAKHVLAGFVETLKPTGVPEDHVFIYAPLNCPRPAGRKGDALAAELDQLGIPNTRAQSFSAQVTGSSPDEAAAAAHTDSILQAEGPAVLIHGWGKSDPSLDEVVATYRHFAKR
jgi:hypothetical protein